jgi:hypothetical protein
MFRIWKSCARLIAAVAIMLGAYAGAHAEDGAPWTISKSSGEVWITAEGVAQASLTPESQLKTGDTIRTGRNGRVLLVRGEESILVSPNSVIGIPSEKKDGLSTTILQQAGSILLEVEKRNVKHFEVETPYLAAVVKGTQFRVSVNAAGTSVDVLRGQVEVADFKSGQIAQLLPGQMATAFAQGKSGLTLSGSGTFNPIEQGKPRTPSIERIMVPKTGLPAPRHATNGQRIRSFAALPNSAGATGPKPGAAVLQAGPHAAPAHNALRISSSLGEVRLNFHQVTHGLARGTAPTSHAGRASATRDTVWSSRNGKASTVAVGNSGQGNSADGGNTAAMTTSIAGGTAAATSAATAAAAIVSSNAGDGNGNDNGNSNGNSNGRGNNANGNGGANGNGNNGNGNNGHGHAYGRGH